MPTTTQRRRTARPVGAQPQETTPAPLRRDVGFKMGADPEFLLFHGSRALNAQNLMQNYFMQKSGLRQGNMGFIVDGAGVIGWDGASSTGEMRPNPASSPEELTENIGKLIAAVQTQMPFVDFTTLSIGAPIGGHMHLDINTSIIGDQSDYVSEEQKRAYNRITKLLASFIMPIIASEHRISSNGRLASGNYGKADDIRFDRRSDTVGTLELRGMSAEWTTSPKICMATLAYFATIMHEVSLHHKELIKEPAILKTKGHISAVQNMMLSDYMLIESAIIKGLAKTIRQFELYPKFKSEIEFILNPRAVMAEKEKAGWNLATGWKLKGSAAPTKKDLFSDKKVIELLKSADHVAIEEGFSLPYNNDYNVSSFSKAISDRIATLNWKLNNEYFLFGLKKGVEGYAAMNCSNNEFYSIPSNVTHANLMDTCDNMAHRFKQNMNNQVRIDPKSGKTRQWGKNQIIIGIPYAPRAENNTKGLIELIWQIERNTLSPKPFAAFTAPVIETEAPDLAEVVENSVDSRRSNQVRLDAATLQALNENETE